MRHRNTHGSVAARNGLGAQASTLGAHKDCQAINLLQRGIVQRYGIVRQRHGGTRKAGIVQRRQPIMRPYARLAANARPRHLENRAHAHAGRATVQRVTASGAHQNAIDVQRSRRAENRANIGVVDNTLKHAHAHRTIPRRLDDAAQELINRNLTRATERRQRAARHVKARQLLHELHGGHEHGNRTRSLAHDKLVKQRHHLVEPALAQKKAHRLISGANRTLDDLGTLSDKNALLRLQHAAKLTLGQSHIGIEPLVLERINSQNLNGISHSSQPAPFFTAHLYQTRRR